MFEKEAEEWLERYKFRVFDEGKCNDPNLYAWSALAIKECYIAGAEFGYNKAKEWQYVKEECKYPENGESVLVTVLDDNNEKIVTMALFELENNKRFWDIKSRLCSVHSGSEEVCSKITAWARVLPAGGLKK